MENGKQNSLSGLGIAGTPYVYAASRGVSTTRLEAPAAGGRGTMFARVGLRRVSRRRTRQIRSNIRTGSRNNGEPMEIERTHRAAPAIAALIIVAVAGCSSSPRFTGRPKPVEPEPQVARAPSQPDTSTPRFAPQGDSSSAGGGGTAADARGHEIVQRAADYLGTPYRIGGTTSHGLDCSGLTFTVYRAFGIQLPRSSRDQARVGDPVPRDDLAVGDLVFFGRGSSSISHVGIYAGDGEFIHASTRARSVRFDRLDNKYFSNRYVTARRVL